MSEQVPWFTCYDGCDCTDVQHTQVDLPTVCPCHGGHWLGPSRITTGAALTGHRCTLAPLLEPST